MCRGAELQGHLCGDGLKSICQGCDLIEAGRQLCDEKCAIISGANLAREVGIELFNSNQNAGDYRAILIRDNAGNIGRGRARRLAVAREIITDNKNG